MESVKQELNSIATRIADRRTELRREIQHHQNIIIQLESVHNKLEDLEDYLHDAASTLPEVRI